MKFLLLSGRPHLGGFVNFIFAQEAVRACCQFVPIRLAEPFEYNLTVP
jgi:hypothetical protein